MAIANESASNDAQPASLTGVQVAAPESLQHTSLDDLEGGRRRLEASLVTRPDDSATWNNLGVVMRKLRNPEAALACYQRALSIDAQCEPALGNLGNILKDLGRHYEAIDIHRQVIARHPNNSHAWHNLGLVYNAMGRSRDACAAFSRAMALAPKEIAMRFDRAIAHLRAGDYQLGWQDYEARWSLTAARRREFSAPQWQGESLVGRSILLHSEQGFGDIILMARCIPMVKALGATVIFECRKELFRLFEYFPGIDRLVGEHQPMPEYALHCPLMSLPKIFQISADSIPPPIAFSIPESSRALARSLLPGRSKNLRIGIVWSGSVTFEGNDARASRAKEFLSLYEAPDVELYSLQAAEPRAELGSLGTTALICDLTGHINDFADTAALVERLDLIVMTDSAVAHLAGSLGRPIWNLLQTVPYWLYGMDGEVCAWYPSMRLFRQPAPGDWKSVFNVVCTALRAHHRAKPDEVA